MKTEGDRIKKFVEKYKEVRVQTFRRRWQVPSKVRKTMLKVLLIQCFWVQTGCLGEEVKRQEIEENKI